MVAEVLETGLKLLTVSEVAGEMTHELSGN
jgi:hypothetical protein